MKTETKKRKSAHKLTCLITAKTRQSNQFYIKKKADKAGTSPEEYQAHYVSKDALADLKESLIAKPIHMVKEQLGWDTITLVKALKYNGRGIDLDYYKLNNEVGAAADDPSDPFPTTEETVLVEAGSAE